MGAFGPAPALRAHLEITDRCNMACAHCFKRAESHDLDTGLAVRVLGQLAGLGVRTATFGGGEPTLHPELPALLAAAIGHGMQVGLVSNGKRFARVWEWLRDLPSGALAAVSFSLDGPDAESHDAIRSPGAFDAVCEAISLCQEGGVATTTKTVVQRRNLGRLEAIVRLGAELGCQAAEFAGMLPTESAMRSGLMPAPADLDRARAELDDLAGLYRVEVLRDVSLGHDVGLVACDPYRARSFSIDTLGRLSLCCMLSNLGDAPGHEEDIVADLATTPLPDAVPALLAKRRALVLRRSRLAGAPPEGDLSRFACTWCAAALGKLDWLADRPESPWSVLPEQARADGAV